MKIISKRGSISPRIKASIDSVIKMLDTINRAVTVLLFLVWIIIVS